MNKRSKVMTVATVLLTVIMIGGIVVAATSVGSKDDPLVTLAYLTEKFKPQMLSELKQDATKAGEDLTRRFDEKISELRASGGGQAAPTGEGSVFSLVTLTKSQTLTCSVGTEILLRVGTATGTGTAPALVNSTAGATLGAGDQLAVNHMYMVTIEGNGIKASTDTVKVMVRGSYTVG